MARIAAQPLEIGHLRLSALGRGDDVVALAILSHPPAGLAGVLVPALDCFYQPAPWPPASAFAPATGGLTHSAPHPTGSAPDAIPRLPRRGRCSTGRRLRGALGQLQCGSSH